MRLSLEFKQKTAQLIKRLDLRPARNESVYSQSYMKKCSDVHVRIKKACEKKIFNQQKLALAYEKNQEAEKYQNRILHRNLGLKPKATISEQLQSLGVKKQS